MIKFKEVKIMQPYTIEFFDIKDNVFYSTVIIANSVSEALDIAKEEAYHQLDKHKIIIRYVSVKNEKHHFVYNMLTKTTEKYY